MNGPPEAPRRLRPDSALAPLGLPGYRLLWTMWVLSNLSTWMVNVAAAWTMVQLPVSALWVALVQAATFLPALLFALPMGTLAERFPARTMLLLTQLWLTAVALLQAGLAFTGHLDAPILLAVTFAYGCGFAMRMPVYHASMRDVVPRERMMDAVALNAASMHLARIAGPLTAGLLIALGGVGLVFGVVALLSLVSALLIWSWSAPAVSRPAAAEPFLESLLSGVRYFTGSRELMGNVARVSICFAVTNALPALLPVLARQQEGADAGTFTVLLACLGAGAMASVVFQRALQGRVSQDVRVLSAMGVFCAATLVTAFTRSTAVACLAMVVAGSAMLSMQATLNTVAQLALPDWVRARGLAIHQMVFLGSASIGAAIWGQLASMTSVGTSLAVAALVGAAGMAVVVRLLPVPERT